MDGVALTIGGPPFMRYPFLLPIERERVSKTLGVPGSGPKSNVLSVAGYFFPSAIPHWPLEIIFAWLSIINSIFLAVSVSLIDPNLRASIRSTFCGVRDCDAESGSRVNVTRVIGGRLDPPQRFMPQLMQHADEKILTSSSTLNSALQFPTGGPGHGKAGGAHLFGSSGFPTLDEQKSKQDNFRRGLSPSHIPRLLKTTSSIEKNPHFPFSPTSNSTSASDDFLRGIWVPPPPPTWKSPCRDKDVMKFYGLHSDDNASDRMPSSLSRDKSCASSSDGSKKDSSDIPDDDDDDNHTYSSLGLGDDESEDDLHCNSLTTDANDDFVFHGPTSAKPPLAPVKEYPNETPSTCSTSKFLGGSLESCTRHKPPLHSHFPSPHQNNNPFNIRLSPNKRHSAAAVSYGLGSHGQDSDSAGKRDNKGRPRAGSGSGSMSPVGGYHSRQLMPSGLHIHRVPHKRGPSPSHTPGPLKPTQRAQSMNALDSLGVDVAEDEPQKTKRSESALTLFTLDPYPPYMPLRRPQPAPPKGFRSVTSLLRRNRANSGNTENFFFGSRYPPPDQLPALPPLGPPPTTNSGGSGKPQSNWMMYRQSKAQSASVPDVRHVFVSEYL
ncbi:unnamed protein product [Cyprideis torosa]|uniref:Uncharacterized protein n=1 Tax=Cyprideis torosa TaxID=163714 RepID=A0A7R8ZG13_9CRUS|nr:unnamed protein product [Cyprideis torosa]CAG0879047.1 unnamed protein product [Cyprideis torosa]